VLEKHFENALHRYPELIEEGLIFTGSQVCVGGKFVDLLFDGYPDESDRLNWCDGDRRSAVMATGVPMKATDWL